MRRDVLECPMYFLRGSNINCIVRQYRTVVSSEASVRTLAGRRGEESRCMARPGMLTGSCMYS